MVSRMSITASMKAFLVGQKKIILNPCSRWLIKVTKRLDLTTFDHYRMGLKFGRPIFFFLALAFMSVTSLAQVTFDSKEELLEAANGFFDQGEYVKAKPLFSQLLSQDALEPNFNYRFGVCMLYTEDDVVKPLPFIEGGANSPGVKDEAHYYLGKAYHLNFRFDEAIEAFQKAVSKSVSINGVDIAKEIQACRNGKLLYNPDFKFAPTMEKEAIESEFFRPYNFRKLKGKVIPTPPNFKSKYDQKNLTGGFVYTPTSTQVLFYASYGEEGATGKDIYRVRRLPTGDWALPVKLPSQVNTNQDEDHAFFDEISNTLYFSSNGHNSMGGLDIFSSKYDASNDSWSAPINLQYPYNSPFDDFLYISDPDNTVAFFCSRRGSEIGKVKVFQNSLVDQSIPELSIITGQYSEESDSTATQMKAQLKGADGIVGEYRTDKTGGYVIVAPPMQGYELTVAPREKEAFDFQLNLPKHYKFKPLEQEAIFRSDQSGAEVALTNYFNSKGKEDSLVTVQRKTSGELPDLVASVKASESEMAEQNVLAAVEQGKEEARQEILAIERKVNEQAIQDSLVAAAQAEKDKAEQLATAEAEQKAEEERIASEAELAAKAAEEAENARVLEEARKAQELAQKKKTLDSLKVAKEQAELLAAAELKKTEEEKARQAAIDAENAAALAEQKRLDDLRAAEEKEAQLALEQQKIKEEREAARLQDSLQLAKVEAERIAKKEQEAAKLEQEKLAAEAQAQAEKARLDSIDAEVERLKLLALEEAKKGEAIDNNTEELELIAAEKAAELEQKQTAEAIALANETALAESESTSALEMEQAKQAAKGETIVDGEAEHIKDFIEKEEKANEELNELSRQVAERTAELSADTSLEVASDDRITELKERIGVLEEEKSKREVQRQLELLEKRMETQKELDQLANAEKGQLELLKESEADKVEAIEVADSQESDLLSQIKAIESGQQDQPEELAKVQSEESVLSSEVDIENESMIETEVAVDESITESDGTTVELAAETTPEEVLATDAAVDVKEFQEEIIEEIEEAKSEVETAAVTAKEEPRSIGETETAQDAASVTEASEAISEAGEEKSAMVQEQVILEEDVSDSEMFLAALEDLEKNLVKEPDSKPAEVSTEDIEIDSQALDITPVEDETIIVDEPTEIVLEEVEESVEEKVAPEPTINEIEEEMPTAEAEKPKVEEMVEATLDPDKELVQASSEDVEEVKAEVETASEVVNDLETEVENEANESIDLADKTTETDTAKDLPNMVNEEPELAAVEVLKDEMPVDKSLDADRKALLDHQKMAAKKEAELKAKMNADKAALGISSSELQEESADHKTTEAELTAVKQLSESNTEVIVVENESEESEEEESAGPQESKSAADEFLEAIKLIEKGQEPGEIEKPKSVEPVLEEDLASQEITEVEQTEPEGSEVLAEAKEVEKADMVEASLEVAADIKNRAGESEKTSDKQEPVVNASIEPKAAEDVEEIVGDFHPQASRVFKIKPALRDYSLRKFDPNTVEDRKTRRLLQRMSAEDRGRLAVMKNIHNASVDAKGNDRALFAIVADQRNSEVLSSRIRVAREAVEPSNTVNWRDRGRRSDITYRLAFDFKPDPVSDRLREAMDPVSEATFSLPTVELESGRYFTLSDARSAQLEYSWRGFEEPKIKAFYKGDQIELLTAIAKPVVE